MTNKQMRRWLLGVAGCMALLAPACAQELPLYTKWENYTTANGMPDEKVLSVAVDDDRVWAGTENGLVLIEKGKIQKIYKPEEGLANRVVTGIAVDKASGDVWIATFGVLRRLTGGQFHIYFFLTRGPAYEIVYGVAIQDE